jgi:hypothetical protein
VRIYNRDLSSDEIQNNFAKNPNFVSKLVAKVPKGTTKIITTLSWQGTGSINVTIESPSNQYTEDVMSVYKKTVYSTSNDLSNMLNMKRLSIAITALSVDENWKISLEFDDVNTYQITIEIEK